MPIDGVINGLVYEHVEGLDNWTSAQREQADLLATIRLPMMTLINDHPVSGSATDYRAMRFGLARTMALGDMYYEFQDRADGASERRGVGAIFRERRGRGQCGLGNAADP